MYIVYTWNQKFNKWSNIYASKKKIISKFASKIVKSCRGYKGKLILRKRSCRWISNNFTLLWRVLLCFRKQYVKVGLAIPDFLTILCCLCWLLGRGQSLSGDNYARLCFWGICRQLPVPARLSVSVCQCWSLTGDNQLIHKIVNYWRFHPFSQHE